MSRPKPIMKKKHLMLLLLSSSRFFSECHAFTSTTRLLQRTRFSTSLFDSNKETLELAIQKKGDEIRALKASGDKEKIPDLVKELNALKTELDPNFQPSGKKKKKQQQQKKQPQKKEEEDDYFITSRSTDYSKWYNDIIRSTGLAETSPVRGCMVIKPWGMSLWDRIRTNLDEKIQAHGAENAYFPLLIPQSFLSKEAEHVDGFAKECAVVTHHRLTAGEEGLIADPDAELEDPLVIRPTSETMIWNVFRKWIKSYRDLPLKVNQWANVLRWELRTRPFLRTSEFLWQEGHTAHSTPESAIEDAKAMLDNYADLCRDLLAIPVVKGIKSPSERFAGAEETYTIEALMQNGWALQAGTSHFLGQSFGNAFDVKFQNEKGEMEVVYGTSWGVSTRLLGALIMTHSDDNGLVLPPKIAPQQVVIVPILPKKEEERAALQESLDELKRGLMDKGIRVRVDDRDYIRNGVKYFEWERKGIPLRIELGPRDVKSGVCIFKYRTGPMGEEKLTVNLSEAADTASSGLDDFQTYLYETAKARLAEGIALNASYEEMKAALENDEASEYPGNGLFLVPWKCSEENEAKIKEECKATIRCYPMDVNEKGMAEGKKCFYSDEDADQMALFGRAF